MTNDVFDRFLDDSTHALAAAWVAAGGQQFDDVEDLYSLNDVLTAHFGSLRERLTPYDMDDDFWDPPSPVLELCALLLSR